MPQMISDRDEFSLEDYERNIDDTARFLARKPSKLNVGNWNLLKVGNTIRLIVDDETLYHVKFEVKHKNLWLCKKQVIQVEVWRQYGSDEITSGLAKAVFFDYLLKHYGGIVCDYLHTENGKRFWLDRLTDAVKHKNFRVFYGDFGSRQCTEITSRQELIGTYQQMTWGKNQKYRYRRMAIIAKEALANCL